MDTTMSHETLRRFEALEARVDALENAATVPESADSPDVDEDDTPSGTSENYPEEATA